MIYCLRRARPSMPTSPLPITSAAFICLSSNFLSPKRCILNATRSLRSTTLSPVISPYIIFSSGTGVVVDDGFLVVTAVVTVGFLVVTTGFFVVTVVVTGGFGVSVP